MTFTFGTGTVPEGLVGELLWPEKQVCLRVPKADDEDGDTEELCRIPLSQFLEARNHLADEVRTHIRD